MKRRRVILLLTFLILVTTILVALAIPRMTQSEFDRSLNVIVSPYKFDSFQWNAKNLWGKFKSWISPGEELSTEEQIDLVKRYFSLTSSDEKGKLEDRIEEILEGQIKEVLVREGIGWTFFPLLSFEMGPPPKVLVISPREKIEIKKKVLLVSTLAIDTRENIESQVDGLGVSSRIFRHKGLGTYPSMIREGRPLKGTIRTITHEWVHHYLFFKPLGFRYYLHSLGKRDYQIATINETVAGIVAKEIGELVYYKYYAEKPEEEPTAPQDAEPSEFHLIMRETRQTVDHLLAQGKVEEAENYMRERRDFLESKGHYIRKLNQAYFAFRGMYADSPESVDPIGEKLKAIRDKSSSLKDFLEKVQNIQSVTDLEKIEYNE